MKEMTPEDTVELPNEQAVAPFEQTEATQARILLEAMIQDGELYLANSRSLLNLVPETARIISGPEPVIQRAERLAEWLMDHIEVSDLMASDQELEQRIITTLQVTPSP